jgi:Uma2 family endonuclease
MGALESSTRLFTPDEVLKMVAAGVLAEDEPLELIEGRLVVVRPQGPPHSFTVGTLADRLRRLYEPSATAREEKPLQLTDGLPEPDVAVVRGLPAEYARRHPRANDVILLVEVAVTSHEIDRAKTRGYARDGVPVVWLLDVPGRRLEVHRDPQPDGRYRVVEVLGEDDEVVPPGTSARWRVGDLVP